MTRELMLPISCNHLCIIIKSFCLSGSIAMMIFGFIIDEMVILVLGFLFILWISGVQIVVWVIDGKIKCRCDKK